LDLADGDGVAGAVYTCKSPNRLRRGLLAQGLKQRTHIEAYSICSKHRSRTHTFGAVAHREILINKHWSPRTVHSATQIAPPINTQDRHADNHSNANDEPLRQVWVDNGVEHVHEERSVRGFDACSSFELGFGHGERARWPGNQLDDDRVSERSNVQHPQDATASGYSPTQQHPDAPKHMEKQDGFCCYARLPHRVARIVPRPLVRAPGSGPFYTYIQIRRVCSLNDPL